MKVTRITTQVKNPDRASIYVDGVYSFSLSLDQLLAAGLRVNTALDQGDIDSYKKLSEEGKLKARTLEWLLIRPRSSQELRHYLRRKNTSPELVDAWVLEFADKKYQDDSYFAGWWVEQRRRGKQRSSSHIRSELRAKGVSSDIIDAALQNEAIDDQQALRALIAKKSKLGRYVDRAKLVTYLQRQGYRYSDITEALTAEE